MSYSENPYERNIMSIKTKFKKTLDRIEEHPALPYVTGALVGIAIMVFSYAGGKAGARSGAREGLNGIKYEFYFKTKDDENIKIE